MLPQNRAPQAVSPDGNPGKLVALFPWLLLAFGCAVYWNCLETPFAFDDKLIGDWPYHSRPLFDLSLRANLALQGRQATGFHAVNVAIHLLAALALYGVIRRSAALHAGRAMGDRSCSTLAFAVALLWLVHPLQTESVTYIWQRSESSMGLFFLTSLYCLIRCAQAPPGIGWGVAAVAGFGLSMASKEVGVMLPPVLLLYDRTFLAGSFRKAIRSRWGLYLSLALGGAALFMILIYEQLDAPNPATGIGFGEPGANAWLYALTQTEVVVHYLRLSFWPRRLCLDYGWPPTEGFLRLLPYLAIVAGLILGTLRGLARRSWLGFAGAWFFLILLPTSSFFPLTDLACEHRLYLPLAAVVLVAVVAADRLLRKTGSLRGLLTWAVALPSALALGGATVLRNQDYRSPVTLWQTVVDRAPRNVRGFTNLAAAQAESGLAEQAIATLQEAIEVDPGSTEAHQKLGFLFQLRGDHERARAHFRRAIELDSGDAAAHCGLADTLTRLAQPSEALAQYQEALRLDPELQDAHTNLAALLSAQGNPGEALEHYRQALRITPNTAQEHFNLGQCLAALEHTDEALAVLREANRLAPELAEPYAAMARILCSKSDASPAQRAEALRLARKANELTNSARADVIETLAKAHAASADFERAIALIEEALKLPGPTRNPVFRERLQAELQEYREAQQ